MHLPSMHVCVARATRALRVEAFERPWVAMQLLANEHVMCDPYALATIECKVTICHAIPTERADDDNSWRRTLTRRPLAGPSPPNALRPLTTSRMAARLVLLRSCALDAFPLLFPSTAPNPA